MMTHLARTMTIDHDRGRILIDGVPFPWYVHEDGPEILEAMHPDGVSWVVVSLPVIVEQPVRQLYTYAQDLQWIIDRGHDELADALAWFQRTQLQPERVPF